MGYFCLTDIGSKDDFLADVQTEFDLQISIPLLGNIYFLPDHT